MSIVINFYPKSSTKKKLQELLIMRDFFKVRYLNEVCDENKIVNYKWFEYHDYQSFTGVYASIIKLDESVKDSLNCSEWILHTKTQIGGSRFDKKKQNDIVREARKIFGGFFENDCFGKNRYTNINDYEDYSPPERGLFIIYENIRNKISLFQFGLENWHDNPWNKQMDSTNDEEIQLLLGSNNPDVILFNALIPFTISIFEYFFKETFKVLLRYNWEKNDSILKERIKVTYRDLLDIEKGDQTIEYILSKEWNFQNLDIINTVFYKYFKLDIFKVLAKRKKVNNKFYFVKNKLEEIIKKRHSVIHELELDNEVNKETFFETLLILKISFSLIVNELNNKNNWNLQDFS